MQSNPFDWEGRLSPWRSKWQVKGSQNDRGGEARRVGHVRGCRPGSGDDGGRRASLLALIDGLDRVWLVYSQNGNTDAQGLVPQTLGGQIELERQRDFYGEILHL